MPPDSTLEPDLLKVTGLRKAFPGVLALRDVSFDLKRGEVHALVGENGAGKSTLLSIMSGVLQADAGKIELEGQPALLHTAGEGRESGIALVPQELSLCPNMTIAENIFLGIEPQRALGWVDYEKMNAGAARLLGGIHADLDPRLPVERLSLAEQQIVEICRALALTPKVIVLDEPTASLGPDRVQDLLAIIDRLRSRGLGIIYVSHRLDEVLSIADRITVLRDGEVVGAVTRAEASEPLLIRMMVGRELPAAAPNGHKARAGAPALEVKGISARRAFQDVSFALARGEILGLAGLMGCHREGVVRALFGLQPLEAGEILVDARPARIKTPAQAIRRGIGYVPADRKQEGLVLEMGVHDNAAFASLGRLSRFGFFSHRRRHALAARFVEALRIRTPSLGARAGTLSGGNQQKVVIAKWLAADRKILVFDEPTRGIDIGAKAQIRSLLQELAAEGRAVLLTSSELPELLDLCDRILVMSRGRITGEFTRGNFDVQEIGRCATL